MAIRELINAYPKPMMGVAICVLFVTAAFGLYSARTPHIELSDRAYFSDDDGQTYFVDDAKKVAPFDHNGHAAVAVHVFDCGNGKQFVGYVERAINDSAKAAVEKDRAEIAAATLARPTAGPDADLVIQMQKNLEVKRPGEAKWVGRDSDQAAAILRVVCPDGGVVTEVQP